MARYIEVKDASPVMPQDKEAVEHSEGDGGTEKKSMPARASR
jgi:hypothetical protein